MALTGDVHGEPPIAGVLDSGGNPLGGVAALLSAADVAVVNLETAVGVMGTPTDKQFTFQADPALVDALADAGVDVVSLANNHALDYGVAALDETTDLAEQSGLDVVGVGDDDTEAYAAQVVEVDGATVAIVGLTRVIPVAEWAAAPERPGMASAYDPDAAAAAVRAAADVADHVVVTIHWGDEGTACPVAEQLVLAHALADAGADVVAGHHPHVLQGIVTIGDTLVAYSLGNFVFYPTSDDSRTTGVLTVSLDDDGVDHTFVPAFIDGQGSPQPLSGDAADPALDLVAARSPGGAAGCDFDAA